MAWDYVVVGAGPAGATLAACLAADGRRSVLLLGTDRAGNDGVIPRPAVRHPALRPHVLEFDAWAESGAEGWSPEDVLPHFKRIETDQDFGGAVYHGSDGTVAVRRTREVEWSALDVAFRSAALEMGHPWAPDHNAPGVLGVSPTAWMEPGEWAGPRPEPLRPRPGMTVAGGAVVDKVLWDGERAVGILAALDGRPQRIDAGEVVLCAGGLGSPAILQRSGVGPATVLRAAGIEPRLDLPVGLGLQTHALLSLAGSLGELQPAGSFGMLARWNTGLEGTSSGDLMAWTHNAPAPSAGSAAETPTPGITGALAQSFSRGRLGVTTADPRRAPAIDAALLSHPLDRTRMRLLYRHLSDLASRPALRGRLGQTPLDGRGEAWRFDLQGRALDAWVGARVRPAGYASSTCRMGAPEDPHSVVDPSGRVLGAHGLRVADGSIMPMLVKAHPWLTEAVIGSRVATLIAAEKTRGCQSSEQVR